ncbi:hypothetical protein [Nocardiopsis alba]|uniref:hypothetical protein n=1 Tax=Nocardiopsis alba TaxID=53437 RepID=UPI0033A42DB3
MSGPKTRSSATRFAKTATSRRSTTTSSGETVSPKIGKTGQRTEKLRTTVDLSPADHRRLRRIADRLADDLDLVEVPRRAVWLALLAEVDADEGLYEKVLGRIKADREET